MASNDNNKPSWPTTAELMGNGTDVDKPASQAIRRGSPGSGVLELLKKHGLSFAMLFSVWGMGYFRFSWSWLLLVTMLMVWRERSSQQKRLTMELARRATLNERQTILSAVNNLPSWVYFPDTERAEWLNKMVKQLWPYIEGYVATILRDTVEPAVQKALPSYLKSFKFEDIKLGTYPPRIGGVKVYTDQVDRDEIILDLELFYAGNCDIAISVKALKRFKAGIESLQLHGTLRVEMKPLVDKVPLIGGMSVYFLNRPAIDFNLTNVADVLDIPGLSGLLHSILEDQLANFLVLPNRFPIKLIDDVDISSLKYPLPQGVLRIHVIEAKNLVAKDLALLTKGKSDPYCVVQVGSQRFKTKVIKKTLNPVWDKTFEAMVYQCYGQTLDIDVWDRDDGPGKDDYLGTLSLNLHHVSEVGHLDAWLPLQEIKQGDIHLGLTWLTLTESPKEIYDSEQELQEDHDEEMDERMDMNAMERSDDEESEEESETSLSAAILVIKLDSAKGLPVSTRSSSLPHPYVNISVGRDSKTSQIQNPTTTPIWEEVFNFLIQSPSLQNVKVEIMDKRKDKCIGMLMFPIKRLLMSPKLALEQPFKLDGSGPQSFVTLKMCLRGLKRQKVKKVTNARAVLMSEMSIDVEDLNDVSSDSVDLNLKRQSSVFQDSPLRNPTPPTPGPRGDVASANTSQMDNVSLSSSPDQALAVSDTELRKRLVQHSKESEDAPLGKVQITLRYSTPRSRLIIAVHKAVDIKRNGSVPPDTYIRMYLLPDKNKSGKRKTKEVKDTHTPVYDEIFEYLVGSDEVSSRILQVTVKDSSRFISLSDPVIGQVEIKLADLDLSKATTDWYILKRYESD